MAGNTDKPDSVPAPFFAHVRHAYKERCGVTIISLARPLLAGSGELPNMFLHQSGFAAPVRHRTGEMAPPHLSVAEASERCGVPSRFTFDYHARRFR